MKTAEEVAEHIADLIWQADGGVDICKKGVSLIANALTAYAEERVREAYDDGFKDGKQGRDIIDDCVKNAVAEAFEEAAKVVQGWIDNGCVGPNPANRIRALKGEAAK